MNTTAFTLTPATRRRLRNWAIVVITGDPLLGGIDKLRRPTFEEIRQVLLATVIAIPCVMALLATYGMAMNSHFQEQSTALVASTAPVSKITQP